MLTVNENDDLGTKAEAVLGIARGAAETAMSFFARRAE
jgi:hypothetical protein